MCAEVFLSNAPERELLNVTHGPGDLASGNDELKPKEREKAMNSIVLEMVRVAMRYLLVPLAAYGAPEPLVSVIGNEATAAWVAGLIIVAITEAGWIKAKMNAAQV